MAHTFRFPALLLLSTAAFGPCAIAVANWPPTSNVVNIGYTSDPTFNPATYRDGGGSGMTGSGVQVINFSDSLTCRVNGTAAGIFELGYYNITAHNQSCASFTHNSLAIMNVTKGNPLLVHDFGDVYSGNNSIWKGEAVLGPANGVDTGYGITEVAAGSDFFIWPNNNMLGSTEVPTLGSNQLLGVYQVALKRGENTINLYSTLATINVVTSLPSGQVMSSTRNVTKMFYNNNQTVYGTFATYSAGAGGDGYLYLFATANGGNQLRVARVAWASMTTMSAYRYWDGKSWSATMPASDAGAASILNLTTGNFVTGDVFYSPYFAAPIIVFAKTEDSRFYVSYTSSSDFTSGFAGYKASITSVPLQSIVNLTYGYAFHSYPHYYPSGNPILVSWSQANYYVSMANLTFS